MRFLTSSGAEKESLAGGALTKIAEVVLSSPATNIDFSSIFGTYSALKLIWYLRGDNATTGGEFVGIRFNNDSGANYYSEYLQAFAASVTSGESLGATSGRVAYMPKGSDAANLFNAYEILVPHYAQATNKKHYASTGSVAVGTGTSAIGVAHFAGFWNSTAAIDRVTLIPLTSTNFVSGSKVVLYGIT